MLAFNRKTDYALISLAHLVSHPNDCWSARELATRYRMPLPLLMNVLKLLAARGIIRSERGPRGGYQLARPAEAVTLYDVIVAVDGPVALVQCLEKSVGKEGRGSRKDGCELSTVCPVQHNVHRVHHRLVGFLKTLTLADIAGEDDKPDDLSTLMTSQERHDEASHLSG